MNADAVVLDYVTELLVREGQERKEAGEGGKGWEKGGEEGKKVPRICHPAWSNYCYTLYIRGVVDSLCKNGMDALYTWIHIVQMSLLRERPRLPSYFPNQVHVYSSMLPIHVSWEPDQSYYVKVAPVVSLSW